MQRWHQLLEEEQEWALLEVSQDADDPSVWAQVPERARERFFVEFPEPEPEARVEDDAMMSPALGGDRVEGVLEGNDGEDVQVPSVPSAQEDALLLLGLSEPHNNEADSDDELPDLEQPSPAIDTPAILPPSLREELRDDESHGTAEDAEDPKDQEYQPSPQRKAAKSKAKSKEAKAKAFAERLRIGIRR